MATKTLVLWNLKSLFTNKKVQECMHQNLNEYQNCHWHEFTHIPWKHSQEHWYMNGGHFQHVLRKLICFTFPKIQIWCFLVFNTPLYTCTRKLIKWLRQWKSQLCLGQVQAPALLPPAPVCRGKKQNCDSNCETYKFFLGLWFWTQYKARV
jgi:hypothetical protein